jgi:uncharacterized protein (UPF0335 family)
MAKKPVKDAPTEVANSNSVDAATELRQIVESVERLESDRKAITEDLKEVMAMAKGRGYDTKILRQIIAERKRDSDEVAEEEGIREMYRAALGMSYEMIDRASERHPSKADDDDGTEAMV